MSYKILNYCSTRVIPDETCEDFIDYVPGMIVEDFPAHVPIEEWKKGGHIQEISDKKGKVKDVHNDELTEE